MKTILYIKTDMLSFKLSMSRLINLSWAIKKKKTKKIYLFKRPLEFEVKSGILPILPNCQVVCYVKTTFGGLLAWPNNPLFTKSQVDTLVW